MAVFKTVYRGRTECCCF